MRYQVGEKLFGIHFRFERMDNLQNSMFGMPYMYGVYNYVEEIEIVELEVISHHKVPSEYGDQNELTCDGYKLKRATDGQVFFNQYPRASYGQTTDTGDRRFFIGIEDEAESNEHLRRLDNGEKCTDEYHLMSEYLRNLQEGINKLREELIKGPPSIQELGEKEWLEARVQFSNTQSIYAMYRDLMERIRHVFENQFPGKTFDMPVKPIFRDKTTGEWDMDYQVPTFTVVEKK